MVYENKVDVPIKFLSSEDKPVNECPYCNSKSAYLSQSANSAIKPE